MSIFLVTSYINLKSTTNLFSTLRSSLKAMTLKLTYVKKKHAKTIKTNLRLKSML